MSTRDSLVIAAVAVLAYVLGAATVVKLDSGKCTDSAETTRLQACVRAGGSWVSGNCVGPLPAPLEGK